MLLISSEPAREVKQVKGVAPVERLVGGAVVVHVVRERVEDEGQERDQHELGDGPER